MCGRFIQFNLPEIYMQEIDPSWNVPDDIESSSPTWNLAPSQSAWVIKDKEDVISPERVAWGFKPSWAKPDAPSPINARSETAPEKPYFRDAWRNSRCVVPADGYYEWQKKEGNALPFMVNKDDGKPMLLAGLHTDLGFAIVTVAAGENLAKLHKRMPLTLSSVDAKRWLGKSTVADDLSGIVAMSTDQGLSFNPVSKKVNNSRNDGAELMKISSSH